jgi:hypothetical protein
VSKNKRWHKLESGQALMEYWPTIPAAIMIIISTGLVVNFLRGSFSQTADALNRVSEEICETDEDENSGPSTTVVGDKLVELVSVNYDGSDTTIIYRVTEAPVEKGNNGLGNGEDGQPPGAPPVNDGAGTSPGDPGNKGGPDKDAETGDTTDETSGNIIIHIQSGVTDNIVDGEGTYTILSNGIEIVNSDSKGNGNDKPKGNNGVGNGEDGQPPGEPPVNDGEGTSPGDPGNKGGPDKDAETGDSTGDDDKPKGNNGVGNGEDDQPPGEPPVNDGEGTSPGDPGNKGGPKKIKILSRQIMNIQLQLEGSTTTIDFKSGNSYEIGILLSGEYDFQPVTVTSSSGDASGVISGPVAVIVKESSDC